MVQSRIHWIDIAKGIAIICVFLGHTICTPSEISSFVYSFHMPVFFFLSGYCFSNRRKYGEFLLNKLKTVVLPIFTLGLSGAVIVSLMLQFIKHEAVDWKWVFLNPIVQYDEHSLLWYLAATFVVFNIFYGLTKLFKDNVPVLIAVSFILGIFSYCFIKFVGMKTPWSVDTALVALPFVATGYGLKKKECAEKLNRISVLIISFAVCIVAGTFNDKFFGGTEMHTNQYGNIALFYVSAFAGCVMVISASMLIEKSSVMEYFGRNSLIFYSLEPIQYLTNFVLKLLSLNNTNLAISSVATIVSIIFIVAVSSLAAFIINKFMPFMIGKKYKIEGK